MRSSGRPIARVTKELGINHETLRTWVRTAEAAERTWAVAESAKDAELARLRKEVAELKLEREVLRKAAAYFAKDELVSRFCFIEDHARAFGVKRLCRILNVSRSGFYRWRKSAVARAARAADEARRAAPHPYDPRGVGEHLRVAAGSRRAACHWHAGEP